ncbi:MAG TPA: hypothetical protein ENN47_06685, partial [Mesotoga infera]|nr:hypothetical protein [Mesotoga infera]
MSILVIAFLHPKKDKRVMRTVEALSSAGDVDYIYWSEDESEYHTEGDVTFHPVLHHINKHSIVRELISRRTHEAKMIEVASSLRPELVYIHHFATVIPLQIYKRFWKMKVPIITDFHEYVPEEFLFGVNAIPKIIKTNYAKSFYRKMLSRSAGAVFVSKWMIDDAKAINPLLKTLWIPNYGDSSVETLAKERRNKEIVFVGSVRRDLEKEKELLICLKKKGYEFTTIGSSPLEGISQSIPFLEYGKMIKRISQASFSIISFSSTDAGGKPLLNYVHSMPNKFFDSVVSGTPIIVDKRLEDIAQIVERDNLGIVIDRNNPEESAETIDHI